MADHGTEMPDAQIRGLYETSAQQLRQRIEQLIVSFAEIEAEAEDLRPTHTDDHLRLTELENRLRYNITALQPLSAHYDQAVAEWDQIDQDYGIMADDTPWTRSMFAFRKKCLTAKSNRPPLPIKINQLIIAFDAMLNSIAAFRNPGERIASPHSPPNPGYTVETPPTVAGSRASPPGATEPPRRVRIASPAHTAGSTPPLARPTPVGLPPPASPDANPRQLAIYNPLRAFEVARRFMPSFGFSSSDPATLTTPRSSSSTAAAHTPVTTSASHSASRSDPGTPSSVARPTPKPRTNLRRPAPTVPIVTQLDHGDDTPVTETYRAHPRDTGTRYRAAYDADDRWDHEYGYSRGGIMSTADPLDGNIHRTSSMAWDRDYRPRQEDRAPRGSDFYTADTAAPRTAPRSGLPPHSGDAPYGPRPSSGPVPHGPPPPSGEIPTRFGDFELPPFLPRPPETSDVTRLAADFNSMAAGRGSEASQRIATPLSATDAAFSSAAPSSGPSGSTATAASRLAQTAFYRKSSYVPHAIPDAALPANLVLKVLPLKTFDGDIRSYPEFRDNFIQLIESQAHLSPQQKLQHLVTHLKGTPLQMAEGFGFTDDSYIQVIELLEARYGDDVRLQNYLLQDLMSLPAPAPRPADLSNFYRDALQIFNRLKRAGMNMDENIVCSQILLAKLPGPIKMRLMENYEEGRIPASEQLEAIIRHLTILERAESAGLSVAVPPSRGTHASRSRPNSRPGSPGPLPGTSSQSQGYSGPNQKSNYSNGAFVADTEHAHAASHREFRHRCAFCGGSHFSARCHIYATITQRERRVRELKQCYVCLGRGHWGKECPILPKENCRKCHQKPHHLALCKDYIRGSRPVTPRPSTPVNNPPPSGAAGAHQPRTSGDARDQLNVSGTNSSSRRAPTNAVVGRGTSGDSGASGAPDGKLVRNPSAPASRDSGSGNSMDNRKKQPQRSRSTSKNKNKKGTNSRQKGTSCHATDASDENTIQKSSDACSGTGLLPGHQALLQTARCLTPTDHVRPPGTSGDQTALDVGWQPYTREDEECSVIESMGHESNPDPFDFEGIDNPYWYPRNDGYAVSTAVPPDSQAVLLECIRTTAVNPLNGASREVVAFFDSGSSITFLTTELARDLDLPQREAGPIFVNTFASKKVTTIEGFKTSLVLRSPQGREVHVNATASDHGVNSVRTALIDREELPPLQKNTCTLISTRERPDILIGRRDFRLLGREDGPYLPCGFQLVNTHLGPMVGGEGRAAVAEPKDVHVAAIPQEPDTSCQPSQMIVIDIMDRSDPRPDRPRPAVPTRTFTTMACPTLVGNATQPVHCPTPLVGPAPRTLPEETVSGYLSGLVEKTDAELLADFSYLENAGMGTHEMKPDDQAAADMLQALHTREPDGRFNVPLLFRTANGEPPSNDELPTNVALAKGRAISTRNTLAKDPKKLADYHEIVLNYAALNFIEIAPRMTPYTKHCLSHHPVFKETSTTTATRPVFDASAKLPGRTCLNDWVFRGPVLLPTVPAILLRSRFPTVIVVSDIGKAFLQMSVKESHRDCLRWFWFKDPFKDPTENNILEYRFNRVPFGLKSSPYLLAGVIKMHLENEGTPLALEMLKNCYVDNVLLLADTVDEALQKYRDSKAIFAKIQMTLRD